MIFGCICRICRCVEKVRTNSLFSLRGKITFIHLRSLVLARAPSRVVNLFGWWLLTSSLGGWLGIRYHSPNFKKAMIRNMVGSIPLTSWKKHTVTIAVCWGGSSLGFARTLGQHSESLRLVGPQSSKCAMTWDMNLVQCKEVMRNQHKMVDWDRCPNMMNSSCVDFYESCVS